MDTYNRFISSFSFDRRLASYDIIGSIAHVKMLLQQEILNKEDAQKIINGLNSILKDINNGWELPESEDVHYAVESELIKRIGQIGGAMHTARSRNDQVALDIRLYVRDNIDNLISLLCNVQRNISFLAKKHINVIMPGYTHLQHAQPILFSHHILAYAWMFQRDKERLKDCRVRVNVLPLGSAALAGTSFKIDRKYVAKLLNFERISENSIDSVSDRDFLVEFLSSLSLIALHLSRLSEELILWSTDEFNFVELSDRFTSGSSIMPQKRNPDSVEIIRGKTGRVYGDLIALLTIMKGLPLSYNRDMQEDKPPVFDAVDTIKDCLIIINDILKELKINEQNMRSKIENDFIFATEFADYLAKKGMPFRQAHSLIKDIIRYCLQNNKKMTDLTTKELKGFSLLFNEDCITMLKPENIVNMKSSYGGTSKKSVIRQLERLNKLIKEN